VRSSNLTLAWFARKFLKPEDREVESIVEKQVKVKSHGKSERHFTAGREEEHNFITRFPGFTRWSLW
jgi:hypothetical protein